MKYRFIVPGIYILLVLLFLVFFLKGAGGHGWNPFAFVIYLAFPAGFLLELLPPAWGLQDSLPLFFLFRLMGLIQWALVGYLIDKLLAHRRKKKLRQ